MELLSSYIPTAYTPYVYAAILITLGFVVKFLFEQVVIRFLHRIFYKAGWSFGQRALTTIHKPFAYFILLVYFNLALQAVELSGMGQLLLSKLLVALLFINIYYLASGLFSLVFSEIKEKYQRADSQQEHILPFIENFARLFLIVIVLIAAVQNMGYNVSGLVASLGIGGIAVALAARESIANIFGSITILFDKPFSVGDWVKGNNFEGIVEEVGFRSTRIRTFAKTLITVPNSEVTNIVVENFSRMPIRRVFFHIGILYSTPPEVISQIVEDIRKMLSEHEAVDQEFFMVKFTTFGSHSLDIMIYYFTKTTAWEEHLSVREDINLRIMSIVHGHGSDFAFPTNTIHFGDELRLRRESFDA
ncbi:mechanosensitive ion channel family protein [Desulfurispira natronophila]|uniref:MscS family membrane protein n=1 Tax=Desulfurispira natronophila TaxID=682562 RepID=A0A7W8DGI7_9BACT|nr:mechanosensitive ion channel family protein [Desulfurispira natronophila]MBB5021404.1 MscS family membrane protein [Desulfurispira natronophila]